MFGTGIGGYAGTAYRHAIASKAESLDSDGLLTERIAQLRERKSSSLILPPEDELRMYAGMED